MRPAKRSGSSRPGTFGFVRKRNGSWTRFAPFLPPKRYVNTNPQISKETAVTKLGRYEPWLIRLMLLAPAPVFTVISVQFIADPVQAAASGIAPESSVGLTNLRSGLGGLSVGSACVTGFCRLSARRLLFGLGFVATMLGAVLGVRIVSVVADDTARASLPVLCAVGVFLILSVLGIFLEVWRQ